MKVSLNNIRLHTLRKVSYVLLATSSLVFVTTGMAEEATTSSQESLDIGARWADAWNLKGPDQAIALYAPDAIFVTATGEEIKGAKSIGELLRSALKTISPHIIFTPMIGGQTGAVAWGSGAYRETVEPVKGGAMQTVNGRYLLLLHRFPNHGWLIERQVWTDSK